jgi:arylsulfatase A
MKNNFSFITQLIFLLIFTINLNAQESSRPNVVIIYADDMGYGDLNCQNPNSKIPTPNLDQLAREGMRFSDAHSSSGICSPSRFALLTGMYHWRRQHGIVNSFGKPFFHDGDYTIAHLLQKSGYETAAIGKWHLGWDWEYLNEPSGEINRNGGISAYYKANDIDWSEPVSGGPLSRGFNYYFGDGTINFPPYAWVENDKFLDYPTTELIDSTMPHDPNEGTWEFRPGPSLENWDPYKVLPTLTLKAKEWINKQNVNKPFFLYFALPSPHAPIIPNDEFIGTSNAGAYGDFMVQTDWVVGEVLKTLKQNGLEENTIVIFTSDNGPERYAFARAGKYGHFSMGDFRGLKRDIWEGGHHVPFIVKWPNHIKSGTVSPEVISQVDIMATIGELLGVEVPEDAAPDSYSFVPVLLERDYPKPLREATVHNTYADKWAIRKENWLYINTQDGEHSKMPDSFKKLRNYQDFDAKALLFDLKNDPEQRKNLYLEETVKAKELEELLTVYRKSERTKK